MNSNRLSQSLLLTFLVAGSLVLLSLINSSFYEAVGLKTVNIFKDIQPKPISAKKVTAKAKIKKDTAAIVVPLPAGLVSIEDFSKAGNGLDSFLAAISQLRQNGRPLHIAFFGDSYIEGDMVIGDLRDTLQAVFGGRGIGYSNSVSDVAGFRQTINQQFSSNWTSYSFIDNPKCKEAFGISGHVYLPANGSTVKFTPVKKRALNKFDRVKIFYSGSNDDTIYWHVGKQDLHKELPENGNGLHQLILDINSSATLNMKFTQSGTFKVYGFSFESDSGIYIDNFSMRGNSGIGLASVSQKMYQQFDSLQHYDLVVMQYGLNVANSKVTQYQWYTRAMPGVIKHIQKSFPHASFLLMGVGDRSEKVDGEMATMKNLDLFIDTQIELAKQTGINFWNLFEAMGGENSMVNLVEKKMANKDYTHLTFSGGRFVANKFAGSLLYEILKYDKKRKTNDLVN